MTGTQIAVVNLPAVIEDGDFFELASIEQDILKLENVIETYMELLGKVEKLCLTHNKEFDNLLGKLVAILHDLDQDIARAIAAKNNSESGSPEQPPEHVPPPRVEKDEGARIEKLCKKLWKKIANRCHPDKTNSETLHDFYHTAKVAFLVWDLQALESIWNSIKNHKGGKKVDVESFRMRLVDKLFIARKRKVELEAEIKTLSLNPMSTIVETWKIWGDNTAVFKHRELLQANIQQKQMEIFAKQKTLDNLKSS